MFLSNPFSEPVSLSSVMNMSITWDLNPSGVMILFKVGASVDENSKLY
jgi:hypothetical protein